MTATHVPARHLRPRGDVDGQPTTTIELFFDLVYVFAITQLSHLILDDLSVAGVAHAAFLLLIVWWAWIYTTWMANWFDPASPAVRSVLTGVMLASLLMAAALPGAFGDDGVLFAVSYVVLQVGRNAAAAALLARDHPLREVFERLLVWSVVSGALWLAGASLDGDARLLLWMPGGRARPLRTVCRVLDSPRRSPGDERLGHRGRPLHRALRAVHHHRARRVDRRHRRNRRGRRAHHHGRARAGCGVPADRRAVVAVLRRAFRATHAVMRSCEDPGRLARDAYTYLHVPIVAGIIAAAVGDDLLIAHPSSAAHGIAVALVLGGPGAVPRR